MTLAFTVDASTAGERLTRTAATEARYGHIDLRQLSPKEAATLIAQLILKKVGARPEILNIAGNGIYTLKNHGWDQGRVNAFITETFLELQKLSPESLPSKGFISGGQTGVDIAAAVMADILKIDAVITFPKGFLQRNAAGDDFQQTREDVANSIAEMVQDLRPSPMPPGG